MLCRTVHHVMLGPCAHVGRRFRCCVQELVVVSTLSMNCSFKNMHATRAQGCRHAPASVNPAMPVVCPHASPLIHFPDQGAPLVKNLFQTHAIRCC